MFIEDSSNVSNCFGIRYQALRAPIGRSPNLKRMPDPPGHLVLGEASWDQVCAVESDVFRFCDWERLLMRTMGIVRLRYGLMKLSEQIFVQL